MRTFLYAIAHNIVKAARIVTEAYLHCAVHRPRATMPVGQMRFLYLKGSGSGRGGLKYKR